MTHRLTTPQASADYHRVARALRFLHEHRMEHPTLSEVADAVGLSEHHFQRMFARWAGISPKRFLQFLTKEHAKKLLQNGATVFDTSIATGLSGAGRLHDLLISTEGVTPGELRAGYHGVTVKWSVGECPFGQAEIAWTDRGVCLLSFAETREAQEVVEARLAAEHPRASIVRSTREGREMLARVFDGDRLPVLLRGSPFQLRVWEALLSIGEGTTRSYSDVAREIGRPSATRAVASAIAQNRVAYLIPCHRVIRSLGQTGEYAWGSIRKRAMLTWESARAVT